MATCRNRTLFLLLSVSSILLGLSSRKMAVYLPDFINLGLGDTLWAVMVYLLFATAFCRWSIVRTALVALAFCYLIEISQLYHAPWIDAIRANRLGGLVLGFGFLWSDIIAYTLGVGSAVLFESFAHRVPLLRNHLYKDR
nr:DUF2809 domain-containing protein [uncultured Acetobacteroides sp.]